MTNIALHVEQTRAPGLLGASQAAAALGLDPYRSPLALWRELRGHGERDLPAFVQEAAAWGTAIEPIIRGHYALNAPAFVVVPEESRIKDGWLRATPDGLVYKTGKLGTCAAESECGRDDDPDGLWQGKTCSAYKGDEWDEWIPPAYEIQVRVEMYVTGLPWCDVTCLVGGQSLRGPFRVERDEKLEQNIVRDLERFRDLVASGKEPDVDGSAAWREYAGSKMRPSKVAIPAVGELAAEVEAWKAARKAKSAAEAAEATAKTKLLLRLSAAGATKIDTGDGAITAYQTGAKASWKDYAMSLGGANTCPDQFKGKPGAWTLRAPWGDADE